MQSWPVSPVSHRRHDGPVFRLPHYTVEARFAALAQSIDWGVTLLHVPDAWKLTNGENVKVGICDTGCDEGHPDLQGAIGATADFTGSPKGAADVAGHGTHCSGIIAARNNAIGLVGVAPKSTLFMAKVLDDSGSGSGKMVAAGIDWCRDQGVQIISMSLGSPQPDPRILAAIQRAAAANIYVVMAAGNDGLLLDRRGNPIDTVDFPARWQLGLAVAAVDRNGQVADFSSRGPEVDIAAPGQDVTSTWPGGGYAKLSGTSMATPFVVGEVALLLARNMQPDVKSPVHDMASLKEHLARTCVDAGPVGRDPNYGWGLIDAATLLAPTMAPVVPPVMPPVDPGQPGGGLLIDLGPMGKVVLHMPAAAGDLLSVGRQ
jgi:subtilisin